MEARLTPAEDPNLKVEWFKDGKPLPTGHRFRYFLLKSIPIVFSDWLNSKASTLLKYFELTSLESIRS